MTEEKHSAEPAKATGSKTLAVTLVVAIGFLALIALKVVTDRTEPADSPSGGSARSITAVHNDAVGDFEAAQASGKPVYVLFHSLTCDPCIEISNVVDEVMPEYSGDVFFVNAITDDASGQELAARFSFQYIPTSFFLTSGGAVHDAFTGAMSEKDMRAYLDALVAAE